MLCKRLSAHVAVAILGAATSGSPLNAQTTAAAPAPTANREVHYYNPAWSPDGKWLSYESDADGTFAIYVVSADGTGRRKLTSGAANDVQASWSPDGQRLVFSSNRGGVDQLFTMRPDGAEQRLLSASDTRDFYATYSRDGKLILFGAQHPRNRMLYSVGVVGADGANRRILTDSTASAEGPRWTRDGRYIVFTRVPLLQRGADEAPRDFIARRNNASQRQYVTPTGALVSPPPDAGSVDPLALAAADPALSPDGRRIAVARTENGRAGIVLLDVQTGAVVGVVAGERP